MHVLRVKLFKNFVVEQKFWCSKIFKNNNCSSSVIIIRYYTVNGKKYTLYLFILDKYFLKMDRCKYTTFELREEQKRW